MGFFSDLKEDLSQAVNELMPEEQLDAVMAGNTAGQENASVDDLLAGAGVVNDMTGGKETPAQSEPEESFDLSSMLDKLEDMGVDEPVAAAAAAEPVLVDEPVMDMSDEPVMEQMPAVEETVISEAAAEPEVQEEEPEPVMEEMEEAAAEDADEPSQEAEDTAEDKNTIQYDGGKEKKMDVQTNRVAVDETAVVTEGMTITGDIISEGSMELIGTVNGNLDILGKLNITGSIQGNSKAAEIYAEGAKITGEVHSQGSVKIGQSSVVIGNILATSAVIAGAVKGDIDVQGPVILDTTAIVMGNIKSKSVQINNGAVIEGMCSQCYADVNPTSFFEEFKKKK
ncbi:MAG: polymer-forming cytoskeletal protein [Lachnospiraceae bacterium]|nr:polymer-forming cytoskeletal protein [Lachnospiraceae bacterium]